MKKIISYLLITVIILTSAFASGSPEEQKQFFESLPGFLQNNTQGSGITTVTTNPATEYSTSRGNAIIERDMASLTRLYKYLEQNYLWEIDYNSVYEAMATAMFNALGDKYTYYVTADDSESYEENVSGKYGGLGFYFSKTYNEYQNHEDESTLYCNISQVFPNTPASRAGMAAGDFITHIAGESVIELSANQCAAKMKGDVGEEVTITVKRGEVSFDITMVREIISVPDIDYSMIDKTTGYLAIIQFYPDTYKEVRKALEELASKGMKKLIIDLRDCPGGDVDSCLNIADMFISSAKLLTVNYKDPSKTIVKWASASTLVDPSVKVAILVNGGSASSAEIFSSTMRDNKRAVLVGQKTFGKGIMQIITLWDNADASVTTASYIPPSGNEIHKIGVTPDYETEPLVVRDEEIEAYKELYSSDLIKKFVSSHPDYTKQNVELFVSQHPEIKLRPEIIKVMVRNEYYQKLPYDKQPAVDTWFDIDVLKALEVLNK